MSGAVSVPAAGAYTPRTRDAVSVEVDTAADGSLVVDMRVPMDGDTPAEREARETWCGDERYLRVRSRLSLNLEGERRQLVKHLTALYKDPDSLPLMQNPLAVVDPLLARRAMHPIALAGRGLFASLFSPEEYLDPLIGYDERVPAAVHAALRRPGRIDVRCARDPLFPWAFLYDDLGLTAAQGAGGVQLARFWGFTHELQVEHDTTSRSVRLRSPPALRASACPTVDPAHTSRGDTHPLGAVHPTWIDDVTDIKSALRALDCDALYLLGHAMCDTPPAASTSRLQYEGTDITVAELLGGGGPRGTSNPVLLFHNACESAPIDRWDNNTLPGYLIERHKGRVCFLGTAAEVPRPVAMEFAKGFWSRFLGGATVGAAIRESRVDLLERFNNPLGLLYSLHGKADTRIVTNGGPQ